MSEKINSEAQPSPTTSLIQSRGRDRFFSFTLTSYGVSAGLGILGVFIDGPIGAAGGHLLSRVLERSTDVNRNS